MDNVKQVEELDVRPLIPIQRHEKLLKMFKELPVGDSFIFINDHDPKPLYYEFCSIHGDVVGWEYIEGSGVYWKVKVTRNEASQGREFIDISTLMDLRKVQEEDLKYAVFHRYGMMKKGDTMEIIAEQEPVELLTQFKEKFEGQYSLECKKDEPGEYVVHITKAAKKNVSATGITIVQEFDVRPFHPAKRHDMVFEAFAALKTGEAFVFTNDHDPKPLYYQIEAENNIPFKWEYLIDGPEAWKVQVSKTKQ